MVQCSAYRERNQCCVHCSLDDYRRRCKVECTANQLALCRALIACPERRDWSRLMHSNAELRQVLVSMSGDAEVSEAALPLSLNILEITRSAQLQHGLRHGDHARYRCQCPAPSLLTTLRRDPCRLVCRPRPDDHATSQAILHTAAAPGVQGGEALARPRQVREKAARTSKCDRRQVPSPPCTRGTPYSRHALLSSTHPALWHASA